MKTALIALITLLVSSTTSVSVNTKRSEVASLASKKSVRFPEKFKLQHPHNGLFMSRCGNDICLKGGLNEKNQLILESADNDFFKSYISAGYHGLKISGSNEFLRHAGYVVHPSGFNGPSYDFAYLAEPSCDGKAVIFRNPYDNYGYSLGYDRASDKVLIVKNSDSRVVNWDVIDLENDDNLPLLEIPRFFHLKHRSTGKIASQCGGDVCLTSGKPLALTWDWPEFINPYVPFGYNALRVLGQDKKYLRHAGYVMHVHPFSNPAYDFAYLPEASCNGKGVVLHNPYGDYQYDLGYDARSDRVLIVSRGASNVEWDFIEVDEDKLSAAELKDIENLRNN